jgi:hypothetical protein
MNSASVLVDVNNHLLQSSLYQLILNDHIGSANTWMNQWRRSNIYHTCIVQSTSKCHTLTPSPWFLFHPLIPILLTNLFNRGNETLWTWWKPMDGAFSRHLLCSFTLHPFDLASTLRVHIFLHRWRLFVVLSGCSERGPSDDGWGENLGVARSFPPIALPRQIFPHVPILWPYSNMRKHPWGWARHKYMAISKSEALTFI